MKKTLVFVLIAILCLSILTFASCEGKPLFTAQEMLPLCDKSAFNEAIEYHHTISIDADVYAVAIHNISGDNVTVDFVDHSRATVTVSSGATGVLHIKEDIKGTIMASHKLYMVIGIPDSWADYTIIASVDTGFLSIEDSKADKVEVDVDTGAVAIGVQDAQLVEVEINTGDVKLEGKAKCVQIETDTGSVDVDANVITLDISTDTGAINFKVTNNQTINVQSDTGSVRGTIDGVKSQYSILVDVDTGSCNVKDQIGDNIHLLQIDLGTGTAKITFTN